MVDKIVELSDNKKYLILDEATIDDKKYYYGVKLDNKEKITNNYLFFMEQMDGDERLLVKVFDQKIKNMLLTAFTVNYLDQVYEEI